MDETAQDVAAPDLNYGAAVHTDKWVPVLPNTDAALYLVIAHVWLTEGTYEKDYLATHAVGFDRFRDYVARCRRRGRRESNVGRKTRGMDCAGRWQTFLPSGLHTHCYADDTCFLPGKER